MSPLGQMAGWGSLGNDIIAPRRRVGGGWEMSSSGQAAGRGRLGNAIITGELPEMPAGIRSNVLCGVEPRRLHHLCIVSFELLYQ